MTAITAPSDLASAKRIGTGLCFVVFPIVFVFAFAVHPALLHPRLLGPSELILLKIAFVPYGIQLMRDKRREGGARGTQG